MENKKILFILASFILISTVFPLRSEALVNIPNFRQLNKWVYKGSAPRNEQDILSLKELGIRTLINLRWGNIKETRNEKKWCEKAGIKYIHVPLLPGKIPSKKDIDKILAILENSNNNLIYVHCKQGVDRTGLVTAIYRIKHEKWPLNLAYNEMIRDGFHLFPLFYWVKRLEEYSQI